MKTKVTPNFKKLLAGASQGEVVIPILRAYLWNPDFKEFDVKVKGFEQRNPDGWFHPSVHPSWPERMLYYYLTDPKRLIKEPLDPSSVMAITQGNFWHEVIELCLLDAGYLKSREYHMKDENTGSRGAADGVGIVDKIDEEIFEFKTMKTLKIARIERGAPFDQVVIDSFRMLEPGYYLQAQEYLRMSGYRQWRGLILGLEHPFEMRELVFPFDPKVAYETRDKYLRVRQAVADQRLPRACCTPKSDLAKACPARGVCEIGLAR